MIEPETVGNTHADRWLATLQRDVSKNKALTKDKEVFLAKMRENYIIIPEYEEGFLSMYWDVRE